MIKILFVSLGCDKNLVDSETMIGLLQDKGYEITNEEKDADVVIINSCCFIGDAKEESIETIIELGKLKETGRLKALIVTGCLAQRYKDEILKELPEVDAMIGTMSIESIGEAVDASLKEKGYSHFEDIDYLPKIYDKRAIASGRCTYCVIPSVRGSYRSIPMEAVMAQAVHLVNNGVRELCLVAQETTLYGLDLYGRKSLPKLLQMLSSIEDLKWIRLLYCYPEEITDELISEIKSNPKVCHYIDMPIQHCENAVLKRMGRATTKEEILERISYIRKEIPDIVLRTSLIAGFPGETKEEHEALMEFVDEVEFNRLGVFTYSLEEDTPAASFDNQVPEEVKEQWRAEIMELQQEVSYDRNASMVGQCMEVIVDGYVYKDDMYMCRSYMDAPDIDGMVFVHSEEELVTGDFIKVKIVDFNEYDLIGERI